MKDFQPDIVGLSIRNLDNGSYLDPQWVLPITKERLRCGTSLNSSSNHTAFTVVLVDNTSTLRTSPTFIRYSAAQIDEAVLPVPISDKSKHRGFVTNVSILILWWSKGVYIPGYSQVNAVVWPPWYPVARSHRNQSGLAGAAK
ncbi:TPA: hypothetical protein EYP12_01940 [Candidatus Bipolaricaulota bacterium]|nr:hypothetical protein [Candidatus Bipolaricaulota bacterium]